MRLEGACSIEEANAMLDRFAQDYNRRFALTGYTAKKGSRSIAWKKTTNRDTMRGPAPGI